MTEHSEHVERETERIRAIRWCEPDVAMERREPEAIAWLEARADELGAALAGCGPFDGAIPVRTTSSLRELVRVWRESLVAGGRTLSWALAKAAKELKRDPLEGRRFDAVEALVRDSQRASDAWRAVYREQPQTRPVEVIAFGVEIRPPDDAWSVTGRPGAMTCAKHLEWCAAFGAARPSPWEPFVAMFERGVCREQEASEQLRAGQHDPQLLQEGLQLLLLVLVVRLGHGLRALASSVLPSA